MSDFMEQLLTYDKDNMDPKRVKLLQKYTALPDFTPDVVGNVSAAAKGLCMWCRAMEVYYRVSKEVCIPPMRHAKLKLLWAPTHSVGSAG